MERRAGTKAFDLNLWVCRVLCAQSTRQEMSLKRKKQGKSEGFPGRCSIFLSRVSNHPSTGTYELPPLLTTQFKVLKIQKWAEHQGHCSQWAFILTTLCLQTRKPSPQKAKYQHHWQVWCLEPRSLDILFRIVLTCRESHTSLTPVYMPPFLCIWKKEKENCFVIWTSVILPHNEVPKKQIVNNK